jgi:hypothetical protein
MRLWCIFSLVGALALGGCSNDSNGSGGEAGSGGIGGVGGEGGEGGSSDPCGGECTETQYCAGDTCDAPGACEEKPVNCTDELLPVCGCDGNTYGNGCEAALVGVRVDFEGQCPCGSNDDCFENQFCDQGTACARSTGTCVDRPTMCAEEFDPVCGCDDQTYDTSCFANAAGAQVSADEPCDCQFNVDCEPDEFCQANTCDGPGYCEMRPNLEDCPLEDDDTRACDGVGYQNACRANANGTRAVAND